MPKVKVKATVMATTMLSRVGRRGAWRERVAMAAVVSEDLAAEILAAGLAVPFAVAAASAGSLSGPSSAGRYMATRRRR